MPIISVRYKEIINETETKKAKNKKRKKNKGDWGYSERSND